MADLFKIRKDKLKAFKNALGKNNIKDKKEVPDNVVKPCLKCSRSILYEDLIKNLYVCPYCGEHFKISARERIRQLLDTGTFREMDKRITSKNEENFIGYSEKLEKAKLSTGLNEAVVCGTGKIGGMKVAIAIMDSNFLMGSMGSVVGEKITRTIEYATKRNLPLIISATSGGARMQEGIISLMQMAKTSSALKKFSNKGGFYISLLTNPTTGGVSASFAMLGDIIIAEPNALIGFAGKRVIENTINETLPDNFQKAEFLFEHGFVDMVVSRINMKKTISDLLILHGGFFS